MTRLETLAAFVSGSGMDALAAHERAALRHHAIDAAVALVAGAASPEGRELAGLLGPGARASEQAGVAAAVIRSTEVDDIHIESCVTPTSVAMPAALLAHEDSARYAGAQAENAIRIALELSVRMGLAIEGPNALYRGVWPTCFATPLAVSAALCRMRGLDEARTAHALSMALMMSSGRIGRFAGQPTGRWIVLNAAFADGVRAYEAGAHGYKGDVGLLDGPWLQNALGYAPQLDALVEDLPASRAMGGLGMKPFSTARQALAPTQALIELIAEGLSPGDIQSIEVRVPEAYAAMISRPLEPYRSSTYSNAGFQMALAALAPDHLLDLDRAQVIADPAILAFAGKVSVKADASLQTDYPRVWAGEIAVRTGHGGFTRKVLTPRGDAANRMSDEEIAAKHMRLLSAALGSARAQEALATLRAAFEAPAPAIALMRSALT